MKKDLLFVTSPDSELDAGLDYALNLAKMTDKGITVLLVTNRKFREKFDAIMTAVTMAEANEHAAAKEELERVNPNSYSGARQRLEDRCSESGMHPSIYTTETDTVTAVDEFLKKRNGVEMVLLGPGVSDDGRLSPRDLSRLVRSASRPVVTISNKDQRA